MNPNNGLPLNETGPLIIAENTLYHGESTPSFISLPIVQPAQVPPFPILETLAAVMQVRAFSAHSLPSVSLSALCRALPYCCRTTDTRRLLS